MVGVGVLIEFAKPGLDRYGPVVAGLALAAVVLERSVRANSRAGWGWWLVDVLVGDMALILLGPPLSILIAVVACAVGASMLHSRNALGICGVLDVLVWAVCVAGSYAAAVAFATA